MGLRAVGRTAGAVTWTRLPGGGVTLVVPVGAVITKRSGVLLLAPLLLALPACTGGRDGRANGRRFAVPWFVPAFLVMVVVNSWFPPPPHIYRAVLTLDTLLLTTAMFSLGLTTRWQAVRAAGVKPLLLAGILAVWLMIGGGVLSYAGYWLFK